MCLDARKVKENDFINFQTHKNFLGFDWNFRHDTQKSNFELAVVIESQLDKFELAMFLKRWLMILFELYDEELYHCMIEITQKKGKKMRYYICQQW